MGGEKVEISQDLIYFIQWCMTYSEDMENISNSQSLPRGRYLQSLPLLKPLPPCPKEMERMGQYGYMDISFGNRVKYQNFYRPEWFLSFFKFSSSIFKKTWLSKKTSILLPLKLNFSSLI